MDEQCTMLTDETEDERLYHMALSTPLSRCVDSAISALRLFEPKALEKDARGYRVGQSYGKDSGVVEELCVMAGVPFISVHNHTTLDPIEAIRFGRDNYPNTIVERNPNGKALLHMVAYDKTTLPTRKARWCCDIYKERKSGMVNVFGIRAFESRRRRSWKMWTPHVTTGDWTLNPILYWTDDHVWQFIRQYNVPYCCLYDQGFDRMGCIGCPLNPTSRLKEFARYPNYERAWKWAITKFWNRLHDARKKNGEFYYWHQFDSPEALWSWWMEAAPDADEDDCQMGLF